MRSRRRGFTLTELLIVVLIIAMLIAILLPTTCTIHRGNVRVHCMSNLRQIGYAMTLYATNNRGAFPRTRASVEPGAGAERVPVWGTGAAAVNPFTSADAPSDNDVTAPLVLLLRTTPQLRPRVFVCPASSQEPDPNAGNGANPPLNRSNFTDVKRHLSYSYQNVYPSNAAMAQGFSFRGYGSDYALAADKNPGRDGGNSINHDLKGQNVLFHDGHVAWHRTPQAGPVSLVTTAPDDIYHTADGKIVASPISTLHDNILLPADD